MAAQDTRAKALERNLHDAYGTGLQGMADGLDAIGGSLEVRSAPDLGTTITGRIPLS